jgi:WD40 repeat protein
MWPISSKTEWCHKILPGTFLRSSILSDWPKGLWLRARTRSLAAPGSPLLMTLDEQDDPIADLAVTQDGGRVVSGSESGRLRVWDLESGALLNILEGHEDEITTVAVINDTQVISGSRDNTLRVWHIDKGDCLTVLRGHSDDITVVKVTAGGKRAFSASRDKTSRLWDLSSGNCLHVFQGHKGPVKTAAVITDASLAVTGSEDRSVRVWDLNNGKCRQALSGHRESITAVAGM